MAKKIEQFGPNDIGAELLPIITRGLYRDPLDAMREYIQNGVDAGATNIHVTISGDLVSMKDDGCGMNRQQARRAIRLGMSEKKPTEDVGFRGIGIYSGFNLCDQLEILTKSTDSEPSRIVFNFKKIRDILLAEEDHRLNGQPSTLNLTDLLAGAVAVETSEECPFETTGTLVMMVGVRGEVATILSHSETVEKYLQSAVPLPVREDFLCKNAVESRFREEDYRIVNLILEADGHTHQLFRPYSNEAFIHRKGIGPRFFDLKDPVGRKKFGFAWVCLNDATKYLPDQELRGLLVKKFGFSVGNRHYFARWFSRAVFNNRITGEIIITHKGILPNASRTEFEPSPLRDALYLAFNQLAQEISSWGERTQTELKAREELETYSPKIFDALKQIKSIERDVDSLLELNNKLSFYESRLNTYKKPLEKLKKDLLDKTLVALNEAKKQITDVLRSKQRAKGKRQRIIQAAKVGANAPAEKELEYAEDKPQNVMQVLQALDVDLSKAARVFVEYVDEEILQQKLNKKEYAEFLDECVAYLEGSL
jgi:hypothetical protein